MERVQSTLRRAEPRSLAAQVATDDPLARAYVDFLIGDLMCCDDEQELRRHRRAITDTVMVYQTRWRGRRRPRRSAATTSARRPAPAVSKRSPGA